MNFILLIYLYLLNPPYKPEIDKLLWEKYSKKKEKKK